MKFEPIFNDGDLKIGESSHRLQGRLHKQSGRIAEEIKTFEAGAQALLKRRGWHRTACCDGREAFKKAKDTYMLVLVKVRDGHRPHVQLAAHLRAYEPLLKACWQEQPALRPTMPEVVCELGRLLEDGRALDLAVESGSDEPHASTQPMVELTAEPLAASRERGDEGRIRVPAVAVAITAAGSGRGTDAFA